MVAGCGSDGNTPATYLSLGKEAYCQSLDRLPDRPLLELPQEGHLCRSPPNPKPESNHLSTWILLQDILSRAHKRKASSWQQKHQHQHPEYKMAVSAEKITLYNLADLKNTSDDALPNYLNSLGLKQSHTLTDVRLGLGYSAFFVAAACFLWDYKLGFESTKYYTAGAVAVYSLLNTALTLWIWLKEKGVVYVGTAPKGETV